MTVSCSDSGLPRKKTAALSVMLLVLAPAQAGCIWIPPQPVTRGDLSLAYLEFEEVLANHPLSESDAGEINRRFDAASLAFFAGNSAAALREVRSLTLTLLSVHSPDNALAASLKVRVNPPVWIIGSTAAPEARVSSMYLVDAAAVSTALRLVFVDRYGGDALKLPLNLRARPSAGVDERLTIAPASQLKAGAYQIYVETEQRRFRAGTWQIADESLDALRSDHARRLEGLNAPDSAAVAQALAAAFSRNNLLQDDPSELNSAQFLGDLSQTAALLSQEIAALEAGKSPYRRRAGDYWRAVHPSGVEIPMRVFAPDAAATESAEPLPLLVAFHGAGGDENMFRFGYGGGGLNRLARQRGFILATPLTYPFLLRPDHLDTVVRALSYDYAIDPARIYVLGHSLGAGAASIVAANRTDQIAAACCIAGGRFGTDGPLSPTLVILGELDPLNPLERSKAAADKAIAAGLPIELRIISDFGHTLVVGNQLESAVDWLLARRLHSSDPKPSESAPNRESGKAFTP